MLKRFFNPEIKEQCPNCGHECSETDILCSNCGENIDELFEQLPIEDFQPEPLINFAQINVSAKAYLKKLKEDFPANTWLKFILFGITFIISIFFAGGSLYTFYILLPAMVIFPAGLIAVLIQNFEDLSNWSLVAGWIIYITIIAMGTFTKNRHALKIIYIIFILLLITNVLGCQELDKNISFE